jgi:hypothetical protein
MTTAVRVSDKLVREAKIYSKIDFEKPKYTVRLINDL